MTYHRTNGPCGQHLPALGENCGNGPARLYPVGWRCDTHAPGRFCDRCETRLQPTDLGALCAECQTDPQLAQ